MHLLAVFVGAFASQVAIAANTSFNIATWKAALMAAFFSGIVAVAHVVIGMIPLPATTMVGISLTIKTVGYQFYISVISTFLVIFGGNLATGALHITSFPSAVAAVAAAISAAVAGVVQILTSLVPAPKPSVPATS